LLMILNAQRSRTNLFDRVLRLGRSAIDRSVAKPTGPPRSGARRDRDAAPGMRARQPARGDREPREQGS